MIIKSILLNLIILMSIIAPVIGQENLEIEGAIKIGTNSNPPAPGTIRYNEANLDFEGYNGEWKSLTDQGFGNSGTLTDIDGNSYLTFSIGGQTWMRENLRTTHYSNGEPLPEVVLFGEWTALQTGAWSWYDNDYTNEKYYGKLYNWYAVTDQRGLCPTGWHVATHDDWTTLIDNLGGIYVAGGKMKSTGTFQSNTGLWNQPNTNANNESGFTGFPGGLKANTQFYLKGDHGYWWTSDEFELDANQANLSYLHYFENQIYRLPSPKFYGLSVRCIQDP